MRHIEKQSIVRVTTYDRTNGFMISAIMIAGFLVAVLFIIWCTREIKEQRITGGVYPLRTEFTEVSLDEENFDLREFPPTAAPKFKSDIESISDAVSTVRAGEFLKSEVESQVDSLGAREVGPVGSTDGEDGIGKTPYNRILADHKRWSVIYRNSDLDNYVQILSFFNIEIGVVRLNDNQILRIKHNGDEPEVIQSDRSAEKKNFYFQNAKSVARRWDQRIVRDLKINVTDSTTVHFYPEQTLAKLREVEATHVSLDEKEIADVLKTKFSVVSTNSGFEFQIAEVIYR